MTLTLISNNRCLEVRASARFTYQCAFDNVPAHRSPRCTRQIHKGSQYVAHIEWKPQPGRAVPRPVKVDLRKLCVHCALANFVDIKIAGNDAA